MKTMIPVATIGAALALSACSGSDDGQATGRAVAEAEQPQLETARQAARALGGDLKARLQAAMRDGGPVAAVNVCAEEAPAIATRVSEDLDLDVGRTALRVRNAANAPDDWEREQLEAFKAAMEAGEDPAGLEASEVFAAEGQTVLRWMKPIPMGEVCATCHGDDIAPEVQAAVAAEYPDDAATGFESGELRGAFTVTVPVKAR